MWLQVRMYLLLGVMFAIVFGLVSGVARYAGVTNFYFYLVFAIGMIILQYMIGPKIIEWTMKIRYVTEKEEPKLHKMIDELAKKAGIPKPKVAVSDWHVPNAFAFGRSIRDGRVCATRGIMNTLTEKELKAVMGHEISHIKNRDVTIITLLSVVPMLCWFAAQSFLWSRNRENQGGAVAIGVGALVLYFVTNLLVLYGSRIREYYADKGSVQLGNDPHELASALYKLVYGSAKASKQELKHVEGCRAFFANDPAHAEIDIKELKAIDSDMSGTIDRHELSALRDKSIKLSKGEKIMEIFTTHPNMLKRIKHLSHLQKRD
ncbi:MAG: zinc metalloprotease HtpX [Candidatus Nanoarchaeia archaeon]|nr:zinc metalloprotease HtpX [Candidatus Nanoarchaeia archaeon]